MVTDPHKVGDGMSSFIGEYSYSCDEITTTWIQISRQNWNDFFSNINQQIMIYQMTYQILTYDDEVCIPSLFSILIAVYIISMTAH